VRGDSRIPSDTPAQLALLAVAAAVRFSPPRRYQLDANPERLSAEEAAARLDELPKPLSIRVAAKEDGLHITTRRIEHRDELRRLATRGTVSKFISKRYPPPFSHLEVICEGAGETIRATVQEVEQFERDYLLEFPYEMGRDFTDKDGAVAVIEFFAPPRGSLEQRPPAA
jgi:hypothetical protein